jgi:hypothetical protein
MAAVQRKISPSQLAWILRQVANPNPWFLVSELALLCGPDMPLHRLRRALIRKGVISKSESSRRQHMVSYDKLMLEWKECWYSICKKWEHATSRNAARDDDEESDWPPRAA